MPLAPDRNWNRSNVKSSPPTHSSAATPVAANTKSPRPNGARITSATVTASYTLARSAGSNTRRRFFSTAPATICARGFTHTKGEVAAISPQHLRQRAERLNSDLAETNRARARPPAIRRSATKAETVLARLMKGHGGFEHNSHSLPHRPSSLSKNIRISPA